MRDGMSLEEMEAAGKRADAIRHAQAYLAEQRRRLDLVNRYGTAGTVWTPSLQLDKGDRWGNGSTSIEIAIPFGVIQQSAVDAVRKAERALIKLGGMP